MSAAATRDVRELRDPRHVADRPDVLRGAKPLVDFDAVRTYRDAEPLEPEARCVGCAAGRDEQPLRFDTRTVGERQLDSPSGAVDADPEANVDPLLAEDVADDRTRLLVHPAEQARSAFDHRHARAGPREELRELRADGSAAQHCEALRHLVGARRLDVRPVVDVLEPLDGRNGRPRARRDHELVVAELLPVDIDDTLARDTPLTANELTTLPGEPVDL